MSWAWRGRAIVTKVIALELVAAFAVIVSFASDALAEDAGNEISSKYSKSTVFLVVHGTGSDNKQVINLGSGFIISGDGLVLTVAHIFKDDRNLPLSQTSTIGSIGSSFDANAPTGNIQNLDYVKANFEVDVALVKLPSPISGDSRYAPVHACRIIDPTVAQGERVYALSYPLGLPLSVNAGTLSSVRAPKGMWKTDAVVNKGSSGGPVFDEAHNVIAVIKGGIEGIPGNNFIVPVNLASDLIGAGQAHFSDCDDTVYNILHRSVSQP